MHSHAFEWSCKCQIVTDTKSRNTSHILWCSIYNTCLNLFNISCLFSGGITISSKFHICFGFTFFYWFYFLQIFLLLLLFYGLLFQKKFLQHDLVLFLNLHPIIFSHICQKNLLHMTKIIDIFSCSWFYR